MRCVGGVVRGQLEEALKEGEELRREVSSLRSGVAVEGEGEGGNNIEDEAQLKVRPEFLNS